MKTNAMKMTQNRKAMRNVVETFRNDLVAPKILTEEGWDISTIALSDADVAQLFDGVGIKVTKRGFSISEEQGQKMCTHIDCLLSLRFMVSRGWLETAIQDGKECFRTTEACDAKRASDCRCQCTAAA